MDLDAYRRSAEEFISELTAEHYRHYSGLKDSYEIEPIYRRHAGLFKRQAVELVREAVADSPPGSEQRRRATMLLDFAVEGFLGEATKSTEAELARREAEAAIELDGRRVGFRESAVTQANEPDAARRALIEEARLELIERDLGPLHRELIDRQHHSATELGWSSYREMCEECKSTDLGALHEQTAAFAAESETAYPELLDPELRRTLDLSLGELRRSDLSRFFRAADQDRHFPAERLVPSFIETMRGLGIDVRRQIGVTLDVEPRPKKSPRAFCAPVRTPGEVYLVIAPVGGWDDYSALFHEGGHTEHSAHVGPRLPFEFRYLGDNSITEAYAFLLQHLVEDPEWLSRRLGVDDAEALVSHARAQRLVYLRRYGAKLAYELELHSAGGSPAGLAERYSQLLGSALQIPWPRQMFLSDVDPGFYCACYLRAWALETHLRADLRERFGPAWFDSREAGRALQDLWREGQRSSPEELLGEPLDFRVLLDDLALAPGATEGG
jgi:hypothetical protein